MMQELCARGAARALVEMGSGSERVALVQLARAGLQSPDEATLARRRLSRSCIARVGEF